MSEKQQQATNEETVRRLIDEVWSQGDYEAANELVAEDYIEHDPALSEEVRGREAFKENVAGFREALSRFEKHIDELAVDGNTVAVNYSFNGIHEGELWGTEPTDREVNIKGMFFYHLEDGRIIEATHIWDAYGLLQQIGAISESPGW